jgi:hypothetical protein
MSNLRAKPDLRTVTISVVRDHAEAQRVQDKLRSVGIESCLAAERSYAVDKSINREMRAVKVQVARTDVQRALETLRIANLASRPQARVERTRQWQSQSFTVGNPIVPVIVVICLIIAALVLFLT